MPSRIAPNIEAQLAAGIPPTQVETTSFVFAGFNGDWQGRTDVQCSLLKAAVLPQSADTSIDRYKPFIVDTMPLHNLTTTPDRANDADDVTFSGVGRDQDPMLIVGILIHAGDEPILHIGHAFGLPLWTNGGDIIVTWNMGPCKIFRT